MSQLENLIELIRTVNEVYFITERAFEHTLIHDGSSEFFLMLQTEFQKRISQLKVDIARIEGMSKPRPKSLSNLMIYKQELGVLDPKLKEIEQLLGGLT